MPPPANQGSRAALVSWTIVASILLVVSLIMAIYFYVDSNRVNDRMKTQVAKYNDVIADEALRSDDIERLRAARTDPAGGLNPSMKLIDVAMTQRNNLAKLIGGSDDVSAASATGKEAIEKAKSTGAKPAGDSLGEAVDALITNLNAKTAEADNLRKDDEDAKARLTKNIADTQSQIDALTKAMDQIRQDKESGLTEATLTGQKQSSDFSAASEGLQKRLLASQEQVNQLSSQNGDLGAQVKRMNLELDKTREKLNDIRIDPTKNVVRQADGHIIRAPGSGFCFIDLGQGDQITPGLTFEVYDKAEGVPAPGDPTTDENLPIGKASIEVVRVGPSSSECRITRLSTGTALSEGDVIANLVYDKNTKYNFVVYGNFDLDQNGQATSQDTEVIKRLITQWGANVGAQINVDTDFVVLGKEPIVPERPKDEGDPIAKAKYDAAVADSEAYADISAKARAYRIPILNQNRFLYLVGYYNESRRVSR